MPIKKINNDEFNELISPTYGMRAYDRPIAKFHVPEKGLPSSVAYNLIHDQLMLDGNARLNLATFVTTWMEPEARQLMADTHDKNMIDKDEYPQTAEIEYRCTNMVSRLWHCSENEEPIGCSTTGSSEACMLAGMAFKWKWRERLKSQKKNIDKPNFVMGINVQVCWEKFCRYWDVEMRAVPLEKDRYSISPEKAIELCDENTIGIVGILGSTFTGEYEPIKELNDAVDKLNQDTGWNIPIHVDAASGGFVAPFIQPNLLWDFRLPWVKSINSSGHKYGLVYPGVGWIVWRDKKELPEDLIFNVNYLGGQMPTFALNFSRPGNQVIAQYYNFLRLGKEGYRRILENCQDVAMYLANNIEKFEFFEVVGNGTDLPVIAWCLNKQMNFTLFDLSERLRINGWQVPAYTLPENLTELSIMRIVVREGFTRELADLLLKDIKKALKYFAGQPHHQKIISEEEAGGFHH